MNYRARFFDKKKEFVTLQEIVAITDSKIAENIDLSQKIFDISTLANAQKNEISFLSSAKYYNKLENSKAGFILIDEKNFAKSKNGEAILLVNNDPYFAYAKIASYFYQEKKPEFSQNNIHPDAIIGQNCHIAPQAYIGKNVEIGANSIIHPYATISDNSIIGENSIIGANAVISFAVIGKNAIIHSGVKIGQDGFGFAHHDGKNHKIIQLGVVEIGDDVEIGANSCVDRGAVENTIIGSDTKIDNLVQIAHNVKIGRGCFLAGCSAVAGSSELGNFVQLGGQASVAGHIKVNDGVQVAGMSGVTREIAPMSVVAGIPAVPIRSWHKINAKMIKMVSDKK